MSGYGAPIAPQILYGLRDGSGTTASNKIFTIAWPTGTVANQHQLLLSGFTVRKATGLAARPSDGVIFAVVQTDSSNSTLRRLVTVNPTTGTCTDVGALGDAFASLSFRDTDVLYGITGFGAPNVPHTLYTLNTINAAKTLVVDLPNGDAGEAIGFHSDGFLYHHAGSAFEKVDVDTLAVTNIGSSFTSELRGMSFCETDGKLYVTDGDELKTINITTGAVTATGAWSDGSVFCHGLAFV